MFDMIVCGRQVDLVAVCLFKFVLNLVGKSNKQTAFDTVYLHAVVGVVLFSKSSSEIADADAPPLRGTSSNFKVGGGDV